MVQSAVEVGFDLASLFSARERKFSHKFCKIAHGGHVFKEGVSKFCVPCGGHRFVFRRDSYQAPPLPTEAHRASVGDMMREWRSVAICVLALSGAVALARRAMVVVDAVIGEVAQRDIERPVYEVQFPPLGASRAGESAEGAELPQGASRVRMVSARGQAMSCVLPSPVPLTTPAGVPQEGHSFDDVDKLLSEYERVCFWRNDGWWTYEFCYGNQVVQKHIPLEGEPSTEFVLGKFDKEADRARRRNATEVTANGAAFTQMYTNGTVCDTTGRPRRALIKYLCSDEAILRKGSTKDSSSVNHLRTVREVESCVYVVEFFNGAICNHRAYKEKLARNARPIQCAMENEDEVFEGLSSTEYRKASLNL